MEEEAQGDTNVEATEVTYDPPTPLPLEEARRNRGFRRRLSESARDTHGDGLARLAKFGNGLRRRLSGSTRDIFMFSGSPPGVSDECRIDALSGLRRHLSASMRDLLPGSQVYLRGGGAAGGDGEGLGRKLSRRLSLLAGTVASRADHTRGSLRERLPNLRRSRTFNVTVIMPDSSTRTVVGEGSQTAGQVVTHLVQELQLATFSLALADSHAEVDLEAPAYLLDGDTVLLQDARENFDPSTELEPRLRMAVVVAATERTLTRRLRCVEEVYGQHLRRLSSVTPEEHQLLFGSVAPVLDHSQDLVARLESAIVCWDAEESCLGPLFVAELWDEYEQYLDYYPKAVRLLREKYANDEEFVALCKLRRGAAKHSLLHLLHLPVERLSEYEQYFASLLVDTHPDHPDRHHLANHHDRISQLVRRGEEEESELERIQDLFPHDDLRLHHPDPLTQKMKGLMRKRSTTAARLQRAFSAKSLRGPNNGDQPGGHNNNKDAANNNNGSTGGGLPPNRTREGRPKRQFIMETPATFTTGVQSQERHLFLFSDLLLVAKARSGGNFKLKEKVRVSEMWLSSCLDDVAEVAKSHDTSFVMGWPTTNVVASFSCVATKDLWYNKLCQVITEERDKEPPSTTVQVTYYDPVNNIDFSKTVSISSTTTARECVSLTLDHLEMGEADPSQFQLWVKTGLDDSPYPLIGHEYPFAIKLNCVRDLLQDCDAEQCNNLYNAELVTRCQFILRQARKLSYESPEGVKKVSKKARKSPIRIHRVFKRSNSKGESLDGGVNIGVLYGQSLIKLVEADNMLPKPVMDMLSQLFLKGPFTVGIFRKSANARLVRELREKLDLGEPDGAIDLETVHITAVAALFKDFLRSLPDCLLSADLYEEWLELSHIHDLRDRISRTLLLCSRLPRAHCMLLQRFLCVLHHITRRASENMMSASNLAVCVGPSILWPSSPVLALSPEASKQVPAVVEFLIERCSDIFGEDILHLLGEPPERDPMRQDSGAEESDSLHSLHSGHSLHSSGGMRRDDSSIDSLERELLVEGELSPLPRKDKMSLTNLSRDSGLTMSDSQLYTPDEEESESTSSGHSGADKSVSNYSSGGHSERSNERFQHYTAPNNPNAIYTAVYRRPEKFPIGYDDPDSYYAAPSREHARVQITYSTPGYSHGPQCQGKEYTRVYQSRQDRLGDVYRRGQEEEAIYSVPTGATGTVVSPPPFVVNSNFQRHDWMRRRSNLRKVSRSSSGEGGLVRSTSEESLLNKYNGLDYGISLGPGGIANKRPAQHGKGRAPPPPPGEELEESSGLGGRESPIRRSKSAHYLTEPTRDERAGRSPDNTPAVSRSSSHDAVAWQRSRSTPQIHDEADRSYDSSTLSDDDSTPHVSRSNSRGKECGGGGLNAWEALYGTEHTPSDSGGSHNSRNSSFKSERTGSMCTVVSAGSTSTLASNPPSYEEALSRRSLMYRGPQQGLQVQGSPSGKDGQFQEFAIREEKMKSARAKQLYEESLRIYQEENPYTGDLVRASPAQAEDSDEYERPPPLPPKCEPPPLPPKQRSNRRVSDSSGRLKHLPPVHVETHTRKSRSVTSLPTSYGCDPPYHKTIIYTDDCPPSLPPKERTVIEIESAYTQVPESRVRQTTSRAVSPPRVEKKSIETQTDDYDLDEDVRVESIQTSGTWEIEPHVTSVSVPDPSNTTEKRRSRTRRKDSSASHRSKSVPTRDCLQVQQPESNEDDEEDEWDYHTTPSLQDFHGGRTTLRELRQLDPDLRQEISWSVSHLRAIFGETLKVHPPPYRPPPSAHRAPITSYHLGAGDSFTSRKSHSHSNYGEESYV